MCGWVHICEVFFNGNRQRWMGTELETEKEAGMENRAQWKREMKWMGGEGAQFVKEKQFKTFLPLLRVVVWQMSYCPRGWHQLFCSASVTRSSLSPNHAGNGQTRPIQKCFVSWTLQPAFELWNTSTPLHFEGNKLDCKMENKRASSYSWHDLWRSYFRCRA